MTRRPPISTRTDTLLPDTTLFLSINFSRIGLWALCLFIALLLPYVLVSGYQLRLIIVVGVYILLTMGLNFMLGYAGLLSLAQVGFFAIGAYFTAIMTVDYHWSFWSAMMAGALASALVDMILGEIGSGSVRERVGQYV